MAAGAGYIEFATGDILTAAAANQYLASQVVMVFADAAARTSAITSPQEGMISYLKDTNATEYYSGTVWAAIGASSSNDLVRITKATFSGSTSVSVNNCFSSAYDFYLIQAQISFSAANSYVQARMRASGTDNTSSTYSAVNTYVQFGGTGSGYEGNASGNFAKVAFNDDTKQFPMNIDIRNPFNAQYTYFEHSQPNNVYSQRWQGIHATQASYDGITLFPSGGTITGELNVYGYKKG